MKKSAFFIGTIISFGILSLLLSDALASDTSSNHITLYTHALELKPIPSSYQLAKSTFLPDRFDDLGLSNYNTLDNNYNSVNCDTYPLSSCPDGSRCEPCPFNVKKFRVLSCNDPYILSGGSGGTCVCPTKVSLTYTNDRCTKYCGSTCIAKTCSPFTNQSGCTNGTQSCDNGCGANTRQCCVACAHKVTSKPSYASYTYSSCYDGSTKQIQTGWKCNSGYHQKDSTCEKDCITNNCLPTTARDIHYHLVLPMPTALLAPLPLPTVPPPALNINLILVKRAIIKAEIAVFKAVPTIKLI